MCTLARQQLKMEIFEDVLDQFEPMIYACMRKLHIYKNRESFAQVGREWDFGWLGSAMT